MFHFREQGQKLLRIDFDTSAGDETYTTLKASLEMAKQLTKMLAEALIGDKEGDMSMVLVDWTTAELASILLRSSCQRMKGFTDPCHVSPLERLDVG